MDSRQSISFVQFFCYFSSYIMLFRVSSYELWDLLVDVFDILKVSKANCQVWVALLTFAWRWVSQTENQGLIFYQHLRIQGMSEVKQIFFLFGLEAPLVLSQFLTTCFRVFQKLGFSVTSTQSSLNSQTQNSESNSFNSSESLSSVNVFFPFLNSSIIPFFNFRIPSSCRFLITAFGSSSSLMQTDSAISSHPYSSSAHLRKYSFHCLNFSYIMLSLCSSTVDWMKLLNFHTSSVSNISSSLVNIKSVQADGSISNIEESVSPVGNISSMQDSFN